MLTLIRQSVFAGLLALTASLSLAQNINTNLPIIELKTGIYRIQAELASTPQTRQVGLMNPPPCQPTLACCLSLIKKPRTAFG